MIEMINQDGFALISTKLDSALIAAARNSVFRAGEAGKRCLLDLPIVRALALELRAQLIETILLANTAVAIEAIAFDKTPDANWPVKWHQDLMFPFSRRVCSPGFELPTVKDGVNYSQPPIEVLEDLLAVRLHLDSCDPSNGPLRVSPGTHRLGRLKSSEIAGAVAKHGETACLAAEGEALVMRPLLLHASSRASFAKHRRVIHFVFHSGSPIAEEWHRQVGKAPHSRPVA